MSRNIQNKLGDTGYPHREHRSKKGRHYDPYFSENKKWKREREKMKADELWKK